MKVNRLGLVRNTLLFCLVGYFAQGFFYAQASIISRSFLLIVLVISGFYFIKTLLLKKNYKNLFYLAWTALLVINVIGYLITPKPVVQGFSEFGMFRGILLSLLTFYPFYYLAQRGELQVKHLVCFFLIMLPITIFQFYFSRSRVLMSKDLLANAEIVNNAAYIFVWLIPFVFFLKKKRMLAFGAVFVLMLFIIQGNKRGAIITGALGLFIFVYYTMRTVKRKNRLRYYVVIFSAIIGLSYYAYNSYQNNKYLQNRMEQMEQGNGSGRLIIYANILEGWADSDSYTNFLFGYGFGGSRLISDSKHHHAHNDWLELLSNFGPLGIFIYALLFYAAATYIFYRGWDIDKRLLMLAVVSMWFLVTLFSMGYTDNATGYLRSIVLAFLIGSGNRRVT
jgi:O-antigen ligase